MIVSSDITFVVTKKIFTSELITSCFYSPKSAKDYVRKTESQHTKGSVVCEMFNEENIPAQYMRLIKMSRANEKRKIKERINYLERKLTDCEKNEEIKISNIISKLEERMCVI